MAILFFSLVNTMLTLTFMVLTFVYVFVSRTRSRSREHRRYVYCVYMCVIDCLLRLVLGSS